MTIRINKYEPIKESIFSITNEYQQNPDSILEILIEIQEKQGQITNSDIVDVARSLKLPAERVFGVATFYSMLKISEQKSRKGKKFIRICDGPVCWMQGAEHVREAFEDIVNHNLDNGLTEWEIERSSCLGLCDRAPAILLETQQAGPIDPDMIRDVLDGWTGQAVDYSSERPGELRVMLAKAGSIIPDSISSALEHGAYCGLSKAIKRSSQDVIQDVVESGLTGRGGAGFPVGRKWEFVAQNEQKPKIVICNADESEPLIFKDRVLIDTNPHQILEGMAIAGYATGAEKGFIYIRGEYEQQAKLLEHCIKQAENRGWLGAHIQGSEFSFKIHVHRGAGAYICGEETALIESLEGKRGEPRLRPPYPPSYGYKGLPTLVNNVESLAAVPSIVCNGGGWYQTLSDWRTSGTKLYMILGHVNKPGIFEAPFGLSLREIINEYGGGMLPGSTFNFALTGGAAGTIVNSDLLDVKIDYASTADGVSLGAGAFLICDQSVSPLSMVRELLHFFTAESCGKCTPCRIGTHRSLEIMNDIIAGEGKIEEIQELRNLADVMEVASLCGLGQSVAIPVKSTLNHFEHLFLEEIK